MTTSSVLRVVAIALTALALVGQRDASADKKNVEEFYGTGFRAPSVVTVSETLSDCGDADPSTSVILQTSTGTVTYTGFMEGTGQTQNHLLADRCAAGQSHNTFRVLDSFESLTVAGRTGGAVVEIMGRGRVASPGVNLNENTVRILCGTGELEGVHAEGTLTSSVITGGGGGRVMQLWVHFGHHHDVGFDFLCRGLDPHDTDD
jgi:hypothetical protein